MALDELSPAQKLLNRYHSDPGLDPLVEDVAPGTQQGVLDTIRRGRQLGGRTAPSREGRINALADFLNFRNLVQQRERMVSAGELAKGSHEYLNFFNRMYGKKYDSPSQVGTPQGGPARPATVPPSRLSDHLTFTPPGRMRREGRVPRLGFERGIA